MFCIFLLLGFLLVLFYPPFEPYRDRLLQLGDQLNEPVREYPKEADFVLERTFDLESYRAVQYWELRIPHPYDIPKIAPGAGGIQRVDAVTLTPRPSNGVAEPGEVMIWSGTGQLEERIVIRYDIHATTTSWGGEASAAASGTLADIPQNLTAQYTHDQWAVDADNDGEPEDRDSDNVPDEWRIYPSHPRIQSLAEELTAGHSTVYGKVRSIFDYLNEHLSYTTSGGLPKACLTTLDTRTGDCDDQSILLISLCRAVGIPAWLELGVLYDKSRDQWEGHGWANVFVPMRGDDIIAPIDVVNNQFLFRDCYRFTEWIDSGATGYFNDRGDWVDGALETYYRSFSYQYSLTSPQVQKSEMFHTVSMETDGSVVVSGSGEQNRSVPGFGPFHFIGASAVIVVAVGIDRRRRRG